MHLSWRICLTMVGVLFQRFHSNSPKTKKNLENELFHVVRCGARSQFRICGADDGFLICSVFDCSRQGLVPIKFASSVALTAVSSFA
jgi:hypothetical protein